MLILCRYCVKPCCVRCKQTVLGSCVAMDVTCSAGFFVSLSIFLSMTSCWCEKLFDEGVLQCREQHI
jgi:hypothetical protein